MVPPVEISSLIRRRSGPMKIWSKAIKDIADGVALLWHLSHFPISCKILGNCIDMALTLVLAPVKVNGKLT